LPMKSFILYQTTSERWNFGFFLSIDKQPHGSLDDPCRKFSVTRFSEILQFLKNVQTLQL
jgi:hypothetical protein